MVTDITNPKPFSTPTTPAGALYYRFVAAIDLSTSDLSYTNRGYKSANILLNGQVPYKGTTHHLPMKTIHPRKQSGSSLVVVISVLATLMVIVGVAAEYTWTINRHVQRSNTLAERGRRGGQLH